MTPEEAKELLARVAGQPAACLQDHMDWKDVCRALETIASLEAVYGYEVQFVDTWDRAGLEFDSVEAVRNWLKDRNRRSPTRIVRWFETGREVVE